MRYTSLKNFIPVYWEKNISRFNKNVYFTSIYSGFFIEKYILATYYAMYLL